MKRALISSRCAPRVHESAVVLRCSLGAVAASFMRRLLLRGVLQSCPGGRLTWHFSTPRFSTFTLASNSGHRVECITFTRGPMSTPLPDIPTQFLLRVPLCHVDPPNALSGLAAPAPRRVCTKSPRPLYIPFSSRAGQQARLPFAAPGERTVFQQVSHQLGLCPAAA